MTPSQEFKTKVNCEWATEPSTHQAVEQAIDDSKDDKPWQRREDIWEGVG